MKTAEDFKEQLQKRNITEWVIDHCEDCKNPIRYMFYSGEVFFNMDCSCSIGIDDRQASWQDIADYYNYQTNPAVIKDMDIFWGFATAQTTELFNPPKTKPF